jgi:hypothetical protein
LARARLLAGMGVKKTRLFLYLPVPKKVKKKAAKSKNGALQPPLPT